MQVIALRRKSGRPVQRRVPEDLYYRLDNVDSSICRRCDDFCPQDIVKLSVRRPLPDEAKRCIRKTGR